MLQKDTPHQMAAEDNEQGSTHKSEKHQKHHTANNGKEAQFLRTCMQDEQQPTSKADHIRNDRRYGNQRKTK